MGYEYTHRFNAQQQRVLESLRRGDESIEDVAQRLLDDELRDRSDLDFKEGLVKHLRNSGAI